MVITNCKNDQTLSSMLHSTISEEFGRNQVRSLLLNSIYISEELIKITGNLNIFFDPSTQRHTQTHYINKNDSEIEQSTREFPLVQSVLNSVKFITLDL